MKQIGELCGCFVEPAKDFYKAIEYCRKVETRQEGPWTFGDDPDKKDKGGRPKTGREFMALDIEERKDLPMH